jgi:MarR family transcriptional regulator, organic hydroperoxide resistance regulator
MSQAQERIAALQQFGRTYRSFLTAYEALVGLPLARWRILLAVRDGGSVSQKRLAEQLQVDPGALTRQLKALEALGWVSRSTDTRDNRITNVTLSESGASVVAQTMPRRNRFIDDLLDGISEAQLQALSSGLEVLETRLSELRGAGAA